MSPHLGKLAKSVSDISVLMDELGRNARQAAAELALCSEAIRNRALQAAADSIRDRGEAILAANDLDMVAAEKRGLNSAMLDRLALNPERLEAMAVGLETVIRLPDPVGRVLAEWDHWPRRVSPRPPRHWLNLIGNSTPRCPGVALSHLNEGASSDSPILGIVLRVQSATVNKGGEHAYQPHHTHNHTQHRSVALLVGATDRRLRPAEHAQGCQGAELHGLCGA